MASFNKVILMGNLTHDPELRYTPKGTAVATIRLAMNRTWKSETGESKEEVTYVDVTAFARQAEVVSQYFKKGRPIMIEGRLRYETWDDKQSGAKRSKVGVVLENFTFVDSNRTESGSGPSDQPAPARPRPAAAAPAAAAPPEPSDSDLPPTEDDDVPF